MYYQSILKALITFLLLCCLVSCSGPKAAANDTWNLVELISKSDPIENIVPETIEVQNCVEPESKSTDCSAGTTNNLNVELGTGAQVGEIIYASIDSSVSTGLGIQRESGQSLDLETPPPGYKYIYQIRKEFQIVSGEVLARSPNGVEQTADYTFYASCSITIVEKEQVSCPNQEETIDNPHPASETPNVQMIRIPSGKFIMGRPIISQKDERPNEGPTHEVFLDDYYIDKYEATNGDYKECVDASVCSTPHSLNSSARTKGYYSNPDYADFPVIHVDWHMANEYCEWRGARLPTEAEWEKAARSSNDKHFPWGQNIISCSFAQYGACGKDTVAVGSHSVGASPYGVQDMAGNVWEWVADWYGSDYYALSSSSNPQGPASGIYRVARGGGWNSNSTQLWVTYRTRFTPDHNTFNLGFRCAKSP
jgi:formylglycine-generating enzyme required for sulfatase activity